jgi:undecaprenyl-diphosphatase
MAGVLSEFVEFVLRLDTLTVDLIVELRHPIVTKGLTSVTGLGSAAASAVFLGLFYFADWHEEFLTALLALLITGVIVGTLMTTIQRSFPPQPVCMTGGADTVATSFPSGHAAAVTAYAMVARGSERLPFADVAALAAVVALSRIYLGTHYLSDTVAGVAIGVLAVVLTRQVLVRVDTERLVERYLAGRG